MPEWDNRYNWLAMVMRLANDDITKLDDVYERTYIECLNILSYWKTRDDWQEEVNKRIMEKNR